MSREVYEKFPIEGFRTQRVESVALTSSERRIYAGTVDGTLIVYNNCQLFDTSLISTSTRNLTCSDPDILRKQPKEKKPISNLTIVESWRVVIGIMDGTITAYELNSSQMVAFIADTKGCTAFAVHERSSILVVAIKRKLALFVWQGTGFAPRREIALADFPKTIYCAGNMIVVGYKRHYESIDLTSFAMNRLLDIDKEHRMVCLELPANALRSASLILSIGLQGVLLDISSSSASVAGSVSASAGAVVTMSRTSGGLGDRLEWATAPVALHRLSPYILSLLQDSVEVHNEASLMSLQRIRFPAGSASATLSMSTTVLGGHHGLEHGFVCTGDQLIMLRMIPLAQQVMGLVDGGQFEDALNLCALCKSATLLRDVDVELIHEKYALSLFQKGDFDGCIQHYIAGKSNVVAVMMLFPDLVPVALQTSYTNITRQSSSAKGRVDFSGRSVGSGTPSGWGPMNRLTEVVLQRAASALAQFCLHHRAFVSKQADLGERARGAGIGAAMSQSADDEEFPTDPEEAIRTSELLDTVLISSLANCAVSRRKEVVAILSSSNRCHIESCAVILASKGNPFTEALLWLYRSHNEHKRVLNALREDKCVGSVGAWSREQFFDWTTEYLRWMWFHETDLTLPTLALASLRPLLEYDAELGLSVLTQPPGSGSRSASTAASRSSSFGGKGVTVQEVLMLLESVVPNSKRPTGSGTFGSSSSGTGPKRSTPSSRDMSGGCPLKIAGVSFPLTNGRALGIAYLEWLVASGTAPANIHNDYAQLLIDGIPSSLEQAVDHSANALELSERDSDALKQYKIYRRKLQHFLQSSSEYHADKLLKSLPSQYLHEYSLLLSRLGRHEEVLRIYCHRLSDLPMAESYCDRMYRQLKEAQQRMQQQVEDARRQASASAAGSGRGSHGSNSKPKSFIGGPTAFSDISDAGEVYLCLMRVILNPGAIPDTAHDSDDETDTVPMARLQDLAISPSDHLHSLTTAVALAEKYFDRFDAAAFLALLPRDAPLAVVAKFLTIVMEYSNTKKRNLQVVHSLLRVREVNLRTNSM